MRFADDAPSFPWLRDRGSLTARLQEHGNFAVRLLRQGLGRALPDEAAFLGLADEASVWVREVALLCDGEAVVFARSVLPRRPRGPMTRALARLGSRSLGALLFSQPGFQRGAMHFGRLDARHPLFERAQRVFGLGGRTLWARRSCFAHDAQAVLVSEVFSPALYLRQEPERSPERCDGKKNRRMRPGSV